MDKKLLLTIQSVCNADGVKIPWEKVGAIMGDNISDGAVIQHLAKLRQRMVAQGLSVPPPLRRGGGTLISTGYSGGSYGASKPTVARNTKAISTRTSLNATQGSNEDDEEEFDVDKASDPDEEFAEARTKRVKREPKGKKSKVKKEDSDDDDPEFGNMYLKLGEKRKRSKAAAIESKVKGTAKFKGTESSGASKIHQGPGGLPAEERTRRSSVDYGEQNDDDDSNDEHNSEEERIGAGRGFLQLQEPADEHFEDESQEDEDQDGLERENTEHKSESPSKMVVLRLGKGELSLTLLGKLANSAAAGELGTQTPQNGSNAILESTVDYTTSSLPRGMSFSENAMDRLADQQLHIATAHQGGGRNHSSSTPSRRSSTGYSAPSPHVGGTNITDSSRYGHVGHTHGFYSANDFSNLGHLMSNQSVQQNVVHSLPTQFTYSQTPGMMQSVYPQQTSLTHTYSNPSSAASTTWETTPSFTLGNGYTGFDTGYGDHDMFDPDLQDPVLGAEGGLDYFDLGGDLAE